MNPDSDFKVGKFRAAIQGEKEKKRQFTSALCQLPQIKVAQRLHAVRICLLMRGYAAVYLFIYLFPPAGAESSRVRGLVHS